MGNTEDVLPVGDVCDHCNNVVLSQIDSALCEFFPITMRRMMLGTPSKAGKIPVLRASKGTITFIPGLNGEDPTLAIKANSPKQPMVRPKPATEGKVTLNMNMGGGKPVKAAYASQLSRAILKIGYEVAWLKYGEMMLEPRFDHVREVILGAPRDGFFYMAHKMDPTESNFAVVYDFVQLDNGDWRMWVILRYAGIELGTDSRLVKPALEVDLPLDVFCFTVPKKKTPGT
jgi:hypothetical protein